MVLEFLNKLFAFWDDLALRNQGKYIKEEIERSYPNLELVRLEIVETMCVSQSELENLKKMILESGYVFPFGTNVMNTEEVYLFVKLIQFSDIDGANYVALIDLDSGYDLVIGNSIIWFMSIERLLEGKETRVFSFR